MPEFGAPSWPVSLREQFDLLERLADALVSALAAVDDPGLKRIGTLAAPSLAAFSFYQVELALAVSRNPGLVLSVAPEAAYLDNPALDLPAAQNVENVITSKPPRLAFARELARAASWTPWHRMPRVALAPEAVAITHNDLLRATARRHAVAFRHASRLLGDVAPIAAGPTDGLDRLNATFVSALVGAAGVPAAVGRPLARMLERQAAVELARADTDLARLRTCDLPQQVWSGTGGYWPARAIGLEVLRRGGTMTRFDHAAGIGLRRSERWTAHVEFSGASHFVVATPAMAARLSGAYLNKLVANGERPQILPAQGDPAYLKAFAPRRPAARRRVLYGPAPMLGARRGFPPIPPDAIGLDWQMRLTAMLKRLPVDLILRPHPEGLLRGKRHPLNDLHACAPQSYETLLQDADVLLFDHVQTTTFVMALCADRAIVWLDDGLRIFADDIDRLLDRRCVRVPVAFDAGNRPHVDEAMLAQALRDAPDRADPTPFRELLLGGLAP